MLALVRTHILVPARLCFALNTNGLVWLAQFAVRPRTGLDHPCGGIGSVVVGDGGGTYGVLADVSIFEPLGCSITGDAGGVGELAVFAVDVLAGDHCASGDVGSLEVGDDGSESGMLADGAIEVPPSVGVADRADGMAGFAGGAAGH